jgi:hypothetical protein
MPGIILAQSRQQPLIVLALIAAISICPRLVAADLAEPTPTETPASLAKPALPRPPNTPIPSRKTLKAMVESTAKRYGVDVALVDAVVVAESGYNPHAVSGAGAVGLMQVMPDTAADYGVHSIEALFNPQTNVRTGVRHLKRLLRRFGIGQAVMAYNAGEGALSRHQGFVTYPETQRYTHRVLTHYLRKKGIAPYSAEASALLGMRLTPTMASAGSTAKGRPVVRQIDPSRLRLRIRPTLSERALDPGLHSSGPDSKPMFELQELKPRR